MAIENEQFVQKAGGEKVSLSSSGFASLQEASDKGGFQPVSAPVVGPSDLPGSNIPGISGAPVISEGTEDIEDQSNIIQGQLDKTKFDLETPPDSDFKISDRTSEAERAFESLKTTTQSELDEVRKAGQAAGRDFGPLIEEAKFEKEAGEAKALVGAGRKGGLQRARFTGVAALGPTAGDTFVGRGGRLEEIAGAFTRNIAKFEQAKATAIRDAETATRQFQRTGKQTDFDNATKLLTIARNAQAQTIQLANEQTRIEQSAKAEARQQQTAAFNIINDIAEGEQVNLDGTIYTGIKKSDVDPFFTGANVVSLMKSLPAGQETSIVDPNTGKEFTLVGLDQDDPTVKSIQTTDDAGNVTITSYRLSPDGGAQILNQASAGGIGKTKITSPSVTIVQQTQQSEDLGAAIGALDKTIGEDGFYNTDEAIKQISAFSINNPGKRKQIVDSIKDRLNPNDPKAKQIITGKIEKEVQDASDIFKGLIDNLPD